MIINYLNLESVIATAWSNLQAKLPFFFFTLIAFILGCLLAIWLSHLVVRILKRIRIDKLFSQNSWKRGLEQSGIKSGISDIVGWVVKWLLILLFLAMAAEALDLLTIANFIMMIVHWLPNLLIAIFVFIAATILADAMGNIVRISINWIDSSYAFIIEKFARWIIWGLAVLIILKQIGVAPEMTIILFQGLVYFLVLSFGLAFGLGGQEIAKDFLKRLSDKIKKE
jgi:hypothetical protein